jgi:[ribosomal protein S18]-alanine N-acetyltransferase
MPIRPMLETDLPIVYAIETVVYEEPWPQEILRDCIRIGYDCWVLEEENTIVGYTVMSINREGAHVLSLAVGPHHQHQGYGKKLMMHLIGLAKIKNAKVMFLEVRVSNNIAIHLYESLGFNRIDVRENYYPKGNRCEDGWVYALALLGEN